MSLTPVEGDNGGQRDAPDEPDTPGLRRRLRRAVAGILSDLAGRLSVPLGGSDESGWADSGRRQTTGSTTAIRTGGQARLESGRERGGNDEHRTELPVLAGEEQSVEATVEGDTLRIHRPDSGEAYIESDVYERVER
jgi:hypothetical protein